MILDNQYPFEKFNSSTESIEYLNPHIFKVDIDKTHNLLVSNDIVNSKIFNLGDLNIIDLHDHLMIYFVLLIVLCLIKY